MQEIGPYRVLGEVARGGMGVVYRAVDPRFGREVAIKVLLDARRARDRERLEREARSLARLRHPHVVTVHSVGEVEGRSYLVMDLVAGETLAQRLVRSGPLEPREAAELARKLAFALAHAHSRAVLHRDLKPANVLIDGEGQPRLTDFGLAKELDVQGGSLSLSGRAIGTPGFWPPEQARGELDRVGPASDVYGLGATLYAMLTGAAPYDGETLVELVARTSQPPPPPSARRRPDLPPVPTDLEAVCLRCLERRPERRYPSADALAADLERFLAGEPVEAAAAGRRAPVAALAVAAVALVALAAGALGLATAAAPPRPPVAEAEADLTAAVGGAVRPPRLAALRERLSVDPGDDRPEAAAARRLAGDLLAAEGWVLLRDGDVAAARDRLARVDALPEPVAAAARRRRRALRAALAGGLAAVDPAPADDPLARHRELEDALEAWPARADELRAWRVRLAARAGRWGEARDDLAALDDPGRVPAPVRVAVAAEAGDRDALGRLLADRGLPAAARGRAGYRLGLLVLADDVAAARAAFERAVALAPDDPLRERARSAAPGVLGSRLEIPARPPQGPAAVAWVRTLVDAHTILGTLDPTYRLDRRLADRLEESFVHVIGEPGVRHHEFELLRRLLALAPDRISLYVFYMSRAVNEDVPDPARDLPIFRRGVAAAPPGEGRARLVLLLARAYAKLGRAADLGRLAGRLEAEGDPPGVRAEVLALLGGLVHDDEGPAAALELLDRAVALAPRLREARQHRARVHWDLHQAGEPSHGQAAVRDGWACLEAFGPEDRTGTDHGAMAAALARWERALGDDERALAAAREVLTHHPDRWSRTALLALELSADDAGAAELTELVEDFARRLPDRLERLERWGPRARIPATRRCQAEVVPALREAAAAGDAERVREVVAEAWALIADDD